MAVEMKVFCTCEVMEVPFFFFGWDVDQGGDLEVCRYIKNRVSTGFSARKANPGTEAERKYGTQKHSRYCYGSGIACFESRSC